MPTYPGKTAPILLLTLLMLVSMTACGYNSTSITSSTKPGFSNIPQGKGTDLEPGTDGKPRARPDGHLESIVVANSIAYTGSDNGTLYAFGSRDGTIRWQHTLGGMVSVYAVARNIVYVTAGTNATVLYAFNAGSGELIWQFRSPKGMAVQVLDGVAYADTFAEGNMYTLYALDALHGTLRWQRSFASVTPGLLGASNGIVYALQSSGDTGNPQFIQHVYALRTSDGQELWHAPIEGSDGLANGSVVVVNSIVYIATTNKAIYAIHTNSGTLVWHHSTPGDQHGPPIPITPVVANGSIYIASNQGVFVYRASDGVPLWQYRISNYPGPIVEQPVVVNDVAYFGSSDGPIVALRATDGHLLWQHAPGFSFRPLVVANGLVINYTGPVTVLRASDGSLLWQKDVPTSGESSLAGAPDVVGEDVAYMGDEAGHIQALRVSDGKLLWHYAIAELPQPIDPIYAAWVTFTPATTYQQALGIVTSMGLKTFAECHFSAWVPGGGKDLYPSSHNLTVAATPNSAPLWFDRLGATPDIEKIEADGPHSCPMQRVGNGPRFLPASQAATSIQVTFTSATSYANALDATNNLGFRVADPCYEQARAQSKKPIWHAMTQANTFAHTYTLVLATTGYNATTWQSQLKSLAGVVKLEAPFTMAC
ncbi:MAG: PQQ-binding-like beta-propeller repeat protein [Ktedonobacteraceae bacterium]